MLKKYIEKAVKWLGDDEALFHANSWHLAEADKVFRMPEGTRRFDEAFDGCERAAMQYRCLERNAVERGIAITVGAGVAGIAALAVSQNRVHQVAGMAIAGAGWLAAMGVLLSAHLRVLRFKDAICNAYKGAIATGYLEQEAGYAQSKVADEFRRSEMPRVVLHASFCRIAAQRTSIEKEYARAVDATARYYARPGRRA